MVFCPKCGKKKIVDVLCEECMRKEIPLLECFKEIEIILCSESDSIKKGGKWTHYNDVWKAVEAEIIRHLRFSENAVIDEITIKNFPVERKPGLQRDHDVNITVKGKAHPDMESFYKEDVMIPVKIRCTISPKYAKKGTEYFEGTLQLRNPSDEAINFIVKEIDKKKKDGVFLNKIADVKGGVDFSITSNEYTQQLAHEVHKRFGGEVKTSAKLFSKDKNTQKDLYRVNALIRLPSFKKDDILWVNNKLIKVLKFKGDDVFGKNLLTGKNTSTNYQRTDFSVLEQFETTISKIKPQIEILDPETFDSVDIANQHSDPDPTKPVTVVQFSGKWYMV